MYPRGIESAGMYQEWGNMCPQGKEYIVPSWLTLGMMWFLRGMAVLLPQENPRNHYPCCPRYHFHSRSHYLFQADNNTPQGIQSQGWMYQDHRTFHTGSQGMNSQMYCRWFCYMFPQDTVYMFPLPPPQNMCLEGM